MDTDEFYERWRAERSQAEPSPGFADRVMHSVAALPPTLEPVRRPGRRERLARAGVCAAAVLAALFRVVELLGIFAATSLEN